MIDFDVYKYNEDDIKERVKDILSEKISKEERKEALKLILGSLDLTSLEGNDTQVKIFAICEKAKSFSKKGENIPNVAAVCFYPPFISEAKENLKGTDVRVATVAGAFPSGQSPIHIKVEEIRYAIEEGADEVDIVIPRGKLFSNKYREISHELEKMREAAGDALMKVILETGELEKIFRIRKACQLSILAGADFLKTSTGKNKPAATPEATLVMLDTIKEYYEKTGKKIGIKPAGGISEPDIALNYYLLVKKVLGPEWLNKKYFRIGATKLAYSILDEIL